MSKYVKLGPNAQQGSFFDPVTKLSLAPGQVAKVPKLAKTSQVYKTALQGQHIVEATEEEFDAYEEKEAERKGAEVPTKKAIKEKKGKPTNDEDEEDEEEDEETEETDEEEDEETEEEDEDDVDSMSKSELVEYLKGTNMPEDEKKNLSKMNKEQLKAAFVQYTTKK